MDWGSWLNIMESNYLIILVDDGGGCISSDDAAKDTIWIHIDLTNQMIPTNPFSSFADKRTAVIWFHKF